MSFETDNQDKSNLVGDAKVMSDAVDREQEIIRLKQEACELRMELALERAKAKAWDKFEELFNNTPPNAILPDWNDTSKSRDFLTINFAKDMSLSDVISQEYNKYLESIRGGS